MAVAGRHADLPDAPGCGHGRHLIDDGTCGAARHPVPALFDHDGDTHGR
jgi:hypothetical protein